MEPKTRVSTALSRRALVVAGAGVVLGAAGLLLPAAWDEVAAERPHERLQDRTPQRNRKQRTQRRGIDRNDRKDTNAGGGLAQGLFTSKGIEIQFANASSFPFNVIRLYDQDANLFLAGGVYQPGTGPAWAVPGTGLDITFGPVTPYISSQDGEEVVGPVDVSDQYFFENPDFGDPYVMRASDPRYFSEKEDYDYDGAYGFIYNVKRFPDSEEYKVFRITPRDNPAEPLR
jgi:hypothetical protein